MPKPRTITHSGTAQVFKGRIPPPPVREEKVEEETMTLEEARKILGFVENPED